MRTTALWRPSKHPGGFIGCRPVLGCFRSFSPSLAAGQGGAPTPTPQDGHSMVDYLVTTCGLSSLEALSMSGRFSHLKSTENPDAVLRVLRQVGLGDDHIRMAVQKYPRLLLCKPGKTVEPRIKALQVAGFSGSSIAQLISLNPKLIHIQDLPRRLEFWRKLVGNEQEVMRAMKRQVRLFNRNLVYIDHKIIPRISLLRDMGVPDDKIGKFVARNPRWLFVNSTWLKNGADKVKGMGFIPGSPMFVHAWTFVGKLSSGTMEAKSNVLRSYGWTQSELMCAIQRCPAVMINSEKKIHSAMSFLLNEAECDPSYIARRPMLLGLSLKKRLLPRNFVLQSLKKRGISPGVKDFWTAMKFSDQNFVQKFLSPYEKQFPELLKEYHAILSPQVETPQ